ncbi:hypothetical protein FE257_012643 [Aspergillus nanangensis]|uniref:Chromatin SPT2 n=1 Tax=Aspergillus nanangensis TaxID=2582783 RepID=A0AAD4CFP5_ASPNN|nr:hypothetical protein FE257_012643 [Aspergillus nanangensis]
MSFLDSVLSSIETGKPSRMPPVSSPPSAPVPSSTTKVEARKPPTASRDVPERKPSAIGTKRKAEEPLQRPHRPDPQAARKLIPSRPISTATSVRPRPITTSNKAPQPPAPPPPKTNPVPSKAPPRGSYADLMAKAKVLQQSTPSQVGMFKHQSAPKEKLSKVERKKRAAEAQTKEKDARSKKSGAATGPKPGDGKPPRKRESEELSYKGTARPTPSPAVPGYRGTSGLPARRDPNSRKAQARAGRRRQDEYLGTDEEDEGDYDDGYDYYSDQSSDMEGGFDQMADEEAAALASARREDDEEWRAELAAKREKEERRKKLASLASRR